MNIIPLIRKHENVAEVVHPSVLAFSVMEHEGESRIAVSIALEPPDETDHFEPTTVTHSITKAHAVQMLHELADLIATH